MVNKVLKIDGYGRTLAGNIDLIKQEYIIENFYGGSGTTPFGTIDNLTAKLAFVNGIEVNIEYSGDGTNPGIDILADEASLLYPDIIDLYWNGSAFTVSASPLGDLEENDSIRIYSLDI